MHRTAPPVGLRCNLIHCFSTERGERDEDNKRVKGKEERGRGENMK
jgi:hypothetical protein